MRLSVSVPYRVYETEMVLRSATETVMKSNITRELKKWYDIMTYSDFAKTIAKINRPEVVDEYMSNRAFFVDEAHNTSTVKDVQNAASDPDDNDPDGDTEARAADTSVDFNPDNETIGIENTTYQNILLAFHRGKRNKIFLFTATPMIIMGPENFLL